MGRAKLGEHAGSSEIAGQDIHSALLAMEEDLQILHGAIENLKLIGWSHQPADPAALAFLSRFAGEALERVKGRRTTAVQTTREAGN